MTKHEEFMEELRSSMRRAEKQELEKFREKRRKEMLDREIPDEQEFDKQLVEIQKELELKFDELFRVLDEEDET